MLVIAKCKTAQQRCSRKHDNRTEKAGQPTPSPQHGNRMRQRIFIFRSPSLRNIPHGTLPQSQSRKSGDHFYRCIVQSDNTDSRRPQPQSNTFIPHDGTENRKHLHSSQKPGRLHNTTIHRCRFALLHCYLLECQQISFVHDTSTAESLLLSNKPFIQIIAVVSVRGSEIEIPTPGIMLLQKIGKKKIEYGTPYHEEKPICIVLLRNLRIHKSPCHPRYAPRQQQ